MKKTLLVLGLLSTSLLARPDDWSWMSTRSVHDRVPEYPTVTSSDPMVQESAMIGRDLLSFLDSLKTKYDCQVVDTSDGRLAFVCFEDDTVVVFCDVDLESFEMDCRGE